MDISFIRQPQVKKSDTYLLILCAALRASFISELTGYPQKSPYYGQKEIDTKESIEYMNYKL